jgi:flagellar basal body-associated protein FliL
MVVRLSSLRPGHTLLLLLLLLLVVVVVVVVVVVFLCFWYSFLLEAEKSPGPSARERIR